MVDTNDQKYKYIMLYLFFEKNYSYIFFNENKCYTFNLIDDINYFINFVEDLFTMKNNMKNIKLYISKSYSENLFVKKIINLYMSNIFEILKVSYFENILKSFNNINVEDFKLFNIHVFETFKKDNIKLRNTNIYINIHHEYNKYILGCNKDFVSCLNNYYDIEFLNKLVMFNIFVKLKEFDNYVVMLNNVIHNIIHPQFNNSV